MHALLQPIFDFDPTQFVLRLQVYSLESKGLLLKSEYRFKKSELKLLRQFITLKSDEKRFQLRQRPIR